MNLHIRVTLVAIIVLSSVLLAGSVTAYHHAYLHDSFAPSYDSYSHYDSLLYAPRYTPYTYRSPQYYRYPSVYARTHDSLLYASDNFIYYRAEFGAPSPYARFRSIAFVPASSIAHFPSLYEPLY